MGRAQLLARVYAAVLTTQQIQRTIEAMPWQELVSRRFSTKGMGTWAYAQGTFAMGDRIGTDISVAYFQGKTPASVYLELDAAPGFLFEASLSSFTRKVQIGLYKLVWEQNKGLILLMQKYFEIIGYLPVLVEAGFVGLIKQVAQDQLIGAGLADASEAFGVNLDGLALILPLLPVHKLAGGGGRGRPASVDLAAQRAVTSEEATANKALTTLAGDDDTVLNRLTPGDARLAKAMDAALSRDGQRMAKAIGEYLDRNEQRMVRVQQQAAKQGQVLQQARAGGTARAEQIGVQAQAEAGGALRTEAASRPGGSGSGTGGPVSGGTTTGGAVPGGGSTTAGGARTGSQPPPRPPRRVPVTIEPSVRPPAEPQAPPEHAAAEAKPRKTGIQVQDEELRKHVLEQLAEKIRGEHADPTEFIGVHDPVTVEGKRFGGGNTFSAIKDKLADVAKLRAQSRSRKKPFVIGLNLESTESAFIFRHDDLKADYDKLVSLTQGKRVPEFEHLNLSPARVAQIREELDKLVVRKVGDLRPDIVEIWFGRWPKVQIADITLAGNDPYHLFKTKVYKRITETMLPGFKVTAVDIKPMPNGSFRFFQIEE